jgi:prepilin signal peptidase PulO-like enzyme (type II secretory pathway)
MQIILPVGITILGVIAGIVINYISDVLPFTRRLSSPFCWQCNEVQQLSNYFFWPRKCPHCEQKRKWRTWVVEVISVLSILWLWYGNDNQIPFIISYILFIYFGSVLIMDIEHRIIMHPVSLAGAFIGLAMGLYLHGLTQTLLGGLAGFGIMLILYFLGDLFARYMAKRRGEELNEVALGFGDVNLAGVIGLILGWPGIIAGLFLTILSGGMVSFLFIIGMVVKKDYRTFATLPYGPFLVFGAVALLYFR